MQRAEPDDKLWYASHHPDRLMPLPAGKPRRRNIRATKRVWWMLEKMDLGIFADKQLSGGMTIRELPIMGSSHGPLCQYHGVCVVRRERGIDCCGAPQQFLVELL